MQEGDRGSLSAGLVPDIDAVVSGVGHLYILSVGALVRIFPVTVSRPRPSVNGVNGLHRNIRVSGRLLTNVEDIAGVVEAARQDIDLGFKC